MNPYLVPGLETSPYAPLCPHVHKEHDDLYVPVDDTEKEFHRFQREMTSVDRLTMRGRLVVVTGKPGCGKTSLINRCAAWLRDELVKNQLTGEIFPLTDSTKPQQSIMMRMEQVLTDVVEGLRDERHGVSTQHIELLERRIKEIEQIEDTSDRAVRHEAKVDRMYKYLQEALPTNRIVIILLPPSSELVQEIASYASFARYPRVVFFAETDYVEDVHRMWPKMPQNDSVSAIMLRVGPLNDGDSWVYARARQGEDSADLDFPAVTEQTMEQVSQNGVRSIGKLHRLLHGVYEELATQSGPEDPLPFHKVSFEYISKHVFRLVYLESGSMS